MNLLIRLFCLPLILLCLFGNVCLAENSGPGQLPGGLERSLVRMNLAGSNHYFTGVVVSSQFIAVSSLDLGQAIESQNCLSSDGGTGSVVNPSFRHYLPLIDEARPQATFCADAACAQPQALALTKYYHRRSVDSAFGPIYNRLPRAKEPELFYAGENRYNFNELKLRNQLCVYRRNNDVAQSPSFDVPRNYTIERFAGDLANLPPAKQSEGMIVFIRYSGLPAGAVPLNKGWNSENVSSFITSQNFFVAGYGHQINNGRLSAGKNGSQVGSGEYRAGDYDPAFAKSTLDGRYYFLGFAANDGAGFTLREAGNRLKAIDRAVYGYNFTTDALICSGGYKLNVPVNGVTAKSASCNSDGTGYFGTRIIFNSGIPYSYRTTVLDSIDDYSGDRFFGPPDGTPTGLNLSPGPFLSSEAFGALPEVVAYFDLSSNPGGALTAQDVKRLYARLVGRPPSASEIQTQLARVNSTNPALRMSVAAITDELAGQEEGLKFFYRDVVGREINGEISNPTSEIGTVRGWYVTRRFPDAPGTANYQSISNRLGSAQESLQTLYRKLLGIAPSAAEYNRVLSLGGGYELRKNLLAAEPNSIQYLFLSVAGRAASPAEIDEMRNHFRSGKSYESVRNLVALKPGAIAYLYRSVVGRNGRPEEIAAAESALRDEVDYVYLKNQLAKSPEAVMHLYRVIAFRPPTSSELSSMQTALESGRPYLALKNSLARNSIPAFYLNVVGREVSAGELATVQSWYDAERRNYDLDISSILAGAVESIRYFYRTVVGREINGVPAPGQAINPNTELGVVSSWYASKFMADYGNSVATYETVKHRLGEAEECVQAAYRTLIGRNPSAAELAQFRTLGESYEPRKNRLAAQSNAITYLYRTIVGRNPTGTDCSSGERGDICRLYDASFTDGGQSFENVRNYLASTPEAIGYFYRTVAGRNPTSDEIRYMQTSFPGNWNYLYFKNVVGSRAESIRHLYRTVAFREATAGEIEKTSADLVRGDRFLYDDVRNRLASNSIEALYRYILGRTTVPAVSAGDLSAVRGWYVNDRRSYDWDIRQVFAGTSEAMLHLYNNIGGISLGGITTPVDVTAQSLAVACPANSYRDRTPYKTYCVYQMPGAELNEAQIELRGADYDDTVKRNMALRESSIRKLFQSLGLSSPSNGQILSIQAYLQKNNGGRSYEQVRYCLGNRSLGFDACMTQP